MSGNIGKGVIIPGGGFQRLSEFKTSIMVPVGGGTLVASYFFSGLSKKGPSYNFGNPSNPAAVVGNPLLYAAYAKCDNENCYDTGVKLQSGVTTIFAIVKPNEADLSNDDSGLLFGDWSNALTPNGLTATFSKNSSNQVVLTSYISVNGGESSLPNTVAAHGDDDFYIVMVRIEDNVSVINGVYVPADGGFNNKIIAIPTLLLSGRNIRIGGHYSTTQFLGGVNVSGFLIYKDASPDFNAVGKWLYEVQGPQLGQW